MTARALRIGPGLELPLDVVTQAVGIVAKRRAGKSYTARRLAEQLLHAGLQVVVVDPKGDWWGIRSSADGRSPGLPVVIVGGERGDVPLEVHGGELVAKLAVEDRVSCLLDLSLLRKGEVATFMTAFLENLYRLKARESYRTPMMLIVDEADAIAPQKPQHGEERMLGAAEDIVRRGGQRGIGCTLVTQRSAVLNKNVLTQVQVLVALRTIAPQDLAALDAWIDVHGTREQRQQLMASLPSLPVGDAWFWSPGWPTTDGIFKRIHVAAIETFDSGATPKPGEKRIEPRNLADVDLSALRKQMAATIERAKADDPRELRKRIAELERAARRWYRADGTFEELRTVDEVVTRRIAAARELEARTKPAERIEVPVLKPADLVKVQQLTEATTKLAGRAQALIDTVAAKVWADPTPVHPAVIAAAAGGRRVQNSTPAPGGGRTPMAPAVPNRPANVRVATPASSNGHADPEIGRGGLRRILIALAQRPQGCSARQLGVRAGLSTKGGTWATYISRARTAGWIAGDSSRLAITEAGLAALGDFDPLPTGAALLDYWLGQLGGGASRILRALADAYPRTLTSHEAAERAGVSSAGGTFATYVSRMRSLELVTGGRGELRASEELFS